MEPECRDQLIILYEASQPKSRSQSRSANREWTGLIKEAYAFAAKVHSGQKRRNGADYMGHVLDVATGVAALTPDAETIIVALLHDCIEDGPAGIEQDIEKMFGPRISKKVKILSHLPDEDYIPYVTRISAHGDLSLIKICDIFDNMDDEPKPEKIPVYKKALKILVGSASQARKKPV